MGLTLTKMPIAVDNRPLRIRGRAGDGLYWALRAAGASSQSAASYLRALATQIDVGAIAPDDRFDLVLANRHTATGENYPGPLLYAGLERFGQRPLQLVAWNIGGKINWVDAANNQPVQAPNAMIWPVNARITSSFGMMAMTKYAGPIVSPLPAHCPFNANQNPDLTLEFQPLGGIICSAPSVFLPSMTDGRKIGRFGAPQGGLQHVGALPAAAVAQG